MATFEDFGLTKNGYITPNDQEIQSLIINVAEGLNIPTNYEEYSIKEIYMKLLGDVLKRCYEREAYKVKQSTIPNASGMALDDAVATIPMTRIQQQISSVKEVMTGDNNTIIENGTQIKNPLTNDVFTNKIDYKISNLECVSAILTIPELVAGDYSITIDSVKIGKEITEEDLEDEPTIAEVLLEMATTINNTTSINQKVTAIVVEEQLKIYSISPIDTFSCTFEANYEFGEISSVGEFFAVETGAVEVEKNTINTPITLISGLHSINNPIAGSIGRDEETDAELKARAQSYTDNNNKYATEAAIRNALYALPGVSVAKVGEEVIATITNPDRTTTKIYGIKSVVYGGDDNKIAQTIFGIKSAGVLTTGNSSAEAIDTNGVSHIVKFSRPVQKYAFIKVKLYKTNDITIPTSYEEGAKIAIMNSDYVKKHEIGQEFTPCYIITAVCSYLTTAIGKIEVEIATTSNPSIQPTESDWTDEEIVIGKDENVVFDASRIQVDIFNSNL